LLLRSWTKAKVKSRSGSGKVTSLRASPLVRTIFFSMASVSGYPIKIRSNLSRSTSERRSVPEKSSGFMVAMVMKVASKSTS